MQSSLSEGTPHEDLLGAIDELAVDLARAAEATRSGRVPISARADYLRAQAAHDSAVATWAASSTQHQLAAVQDALRKCRAALDAAGVRLRV